MREWNGEYSHDVYWTGGLPYSNEPVDALRAPGGWTATPASGIGFWRHSWEHPDHPFNRADFDALVAPHLTGMARKIRRFRSELRRRAVGMWDAACGYIDDY